MAVADIEAEAGLSEGISLETIGQTLWKEAREGAELAGLPMKGQRKAKRAELRQVRKHWTFKAENAEPSEVVEYSIWPRQIAG
jgi:hypothetical protein